MAVRPADGERERAVLVLKRAYANGRIDHDEFEARAHRALEARSPLELKFQLRGLLVDDVRRRARRATVIAGIAASWIVFSFFLAVAFVVALVATHAAQWTLAFPLVWVVLTALAFRAARRAR